MPHRREVLLGLMLTLGGPAVLAQAKAGKVGAILDKVTQGAAPVFYTRDELVLVTLLADKIIPRTDTPGALDAEVPAYLDKMIAAWASDATKASHRQAIVGVRARIAALAGGDITVLSAAELQQAVAALDKEAYADAVPPSPLGRGGGTAPASVADQYRSLKTLIGQVYYASEPGATQELHYELIPGRWLADAPLAEIGRTWAE